MHETLTMYCEFLGYASCSAMSTFEALVLFGALAAIFTWLSIIVSSIMRLFFER
jgi:hypothetical protein